MVGGGQRHTSDALPPGRRTGARCIGGLVGPRAGLDGCVKCRPILSLDRPGRSESLYRLSYRGPLGWNVHGLNIFDFQC